jgi:hypothetical protein
LNLSLLPAFKLIKLDDDGIHLSELQVRSSSSFYWLVQ